MGKDNKEKKELTLLPLTIEVELLGKTTHLTDGREDGQERTGMYKDIDVPEDIVIAYTKDYLADNYPNWKTNPEKDNLQEVFDADPEEIRNADGTVNVDRIIEMAEEVNALEIEKQIQDDYPYGF